MLPHQHQQQQLHSQTMAYRMAAHEEPQQFQQHPSYMFPQQPNMRTPDHQPYLGPQHQQPMPMAQMPPQMGPSPVHQVQQGYPQQQHLQQTHPHQAPMPMPTPVAHHPHGPPPPQHHPQYMQQPNHMPMPGMVGPPPPHHQAQGQLPTGMHVERRGLPSVTQIILDEIKAYETIDSQLNFTAPASLPPLVTTLESQELKLSLQDAGCVRPCHMRSTIYMVPTTKDILESSGIDFAVVIKPFDEGEVEGRFYTPLSPSEIVRCDRCQAYANPFSKNGQCCICNFTTKGLQELDQRPELHLGSYEFRVTPEYYRDSIAETRRPHIIFAIEMTANSRHLVEFVSVNLAKVIKSHLPSDFLYSASLCPLVGFLTYNSKITLYDVMNGGHAYVISDMSSVTECASTSKFLVDPAENFAEIEKFLGSLTELCREQAEFEQQTVLGPVIEAAFKACINDTSNNFQGDQKKSPGHKVIPAGKIYMLHSSLPTYGDDQTPGRLGTKRNIDEMKRHLGTDSESKILSPEGKYYTQLAMKCFTDYASGVELFLFPPNPRSFLNIATLGELSRLTGTGVINKYHLSSLENFIEDLKFSLKSTVGFDATIRVRTSTGISPVRYIGNFSNTTGSNLEMAAVNTSSNFIVQMRYDDKLPENDLVIVQFATIYTSVCGERRVRVHNLALSTCQSHHELYKFTCCDTLVNVIMRDVIDKMRTGAMTPKVAREHVLSRVINILATYRKTCTDQQTSDIRSQLVLPENLKLLPAYLCGALKCDALDGGAEMFPDDKVLAQLNLLGALPSQSQVTFYPRMYSIEACTADDEENEYGLNAVLTRCFSVPIEEEMSYCFILENGYYLFIFFPNTELGQNFLGAVFGSRKDDQDLMWGFRNRDSKETIFIEKRIAQITSERRRALRICVARQGRDKMEHVFRTFLYEDKKRAGGMGPPKLSNSTYADILCYLHQEIRSKLSQ